jgi:HAMP domain-containing protein
MRRSYERVGFSAILPLLPGFLAGAAGPITLALYFEMSGGQFLRILLAAEFGIWLPEFVVAGTIVHMRARPLTAWIAGARGEQQAISAWRAGSTLPRDLFRHPAPYLLVAITALGFDFYAASQLDLPALGGGLVIFLGSIVQYSFWAVLRLFILEASLRPALEDLSAELPDGVHLEVPRMSLGWRLLVALPVMNLAAGTVLAGIFAQGEGTLGDFMLGVLGAVIVTLTISIWLIGFISDSVATSMRDLRAGARLIGEGAFDARVPVAASDETGELAQSFNQMAAGLVRHVRRQGGRRAHPPRGHVAGWRGGRGDHDVHRHPRLHGVLRAPHRPGGGRDGEPALGARRARDPRPRWACRQVHRRRPACRVRSPKADRRSRRPSISRRA